VLAEGAIQRNPVLVGHLLDVIARAKIVSSAKMPTNVVSVGNTVNYQGETTGQEKPVMLINPEDACMGPGGR